MVRNKARLIAVGSCLIAALSLSYAIVQHYYLKKSQRITRQGGYRADITDKPLPYSRLVDFSGNPLEDNEIRRGKVLLVLLSSNCEACFNEGRFLKTIVDKYGDLRFYGALLFWSDQSIKGIEDKFPMKLFIDEDSLLRRALEVKSLPIKLFLKDGVIKKVWVGSAISSRVEKEFIEDLEELSRN